MKVRDEIRAPSSILNTETGPRKELSGATAMKRAPGESAMLPVTSLVRIGGG